VGVWGGGVGVTVQWCEVLSVKDCCIEAAGGCVGWRCGCDSAVVCTVATQDPQCSLQIGSQVLQQLLTYQAHVSPISCNICT